MRVEAFTEWLREEGYPENQVDSHLNRCWRVELAEGELDEWLRGDRRAELLARFRYSKSDARNGVLQRHHVHVGGNVYDGTACLKSSLVLYCLFHDGGHRPPRRGIRTAAHYETRESYSRFLRTFDIDAEQMLQYGMAESIFASSEQAMTNWLQLVQSLTSNQELKIRKDRSGNTDLWHRLYVYLFGNESITEDKDGNTTPIDALATATGYTTRDNDGCTRLKNYILSHVFDRRAMNPLLFGGVYNFAFTPTLIDPLTGMATGEFALNFRRRFREFAHQQFSEVYRAFKEFVGEHNVLERILQFRADNVEQEKLDKFIARAYAQWNPNFEL